MRFPNKIQSICDELEARYRTLTRNPILAEEVVEFAASTCWCRWSCKDTESLKRLILTVAKNHYISLFKKQSRTCTLPDLDLLPGRNESDEEDEMVGRLREFVKRLPQSWQMVIELLYVENQSNKYVSEVMSVSPATIKRWHKRAREALRSMLVGHR